MPLLILLLAGCDGGKSDIYDWALSFDGEGCVLIDLDAAAQSTAMTIEIKVNGESERTDHLQPLVIWEGNFALVELADGTTWFGDPALDEGAPSTTSISDDAWHVVAGVREEDGRVSLFVDGQLKSFARPTMGEPVGTLSVGCWPAQAEGFEGFIDEVRLSNLARYTADYDTTDLTIDADTVGLWRFNEGEGEVAEDEVGGYDGEVRSATWIPTEDTET
ncbi:MAG: hypothetical protein H6741_17120 [Alphaproteobacteria bacterium]|nr:hypothetical protein [Alphaproteobacteria bacterium]MCB9794438.1 hypothetical protein [Alphaproteobacteria bacterium]